MTSFPHLFEMLFTIYSPLPEAFGCISGLYSSETDLFYLFKNHYQLNY